MEGVKNPENLADVVCEWPLTSPDRRNDRLREMWRGEGVKNTVTFSDIIYGCPPDDFIADVGGYMGLLLGYSLLGIGHTSMEWLTDTKMWKSTFRDSE